VVSQHKALFGLAATSSEDQIENAPTNESIVVDDNVGGLVVIAHDSVAASAAFAEGTAAASAWVRPTASRLPTSLSMDTSYATAPAAMPSTTATIAESCAIDAKVKAIVSDDSNFVRYDTLSRVQHSKAHTKPHVQQTQTQNQTHSALGVRPSIARLSTNKYSRPSPLLTGTGSCTLAFDAARKAAVHYHPPSSASSCSSSYSSSSSSASFSSYGLSHTVNNTTSSDSHKEASLNVVSSSSSSSVTRRAKRSLQQLQECVDSGGRVDDDGDRTGRLRAGERL
jgi:hypothetical protein